jgi:arsenate reductase (glutaredoxin)
MITAYGIKNCDTCRKALKWLANEGLNHEFHDFRVDGLDEKTVSAFVKGLGLEALVNRRSTSWRALDDAARAVFDDGDGQAVISLLTDNPTLIKRPVFVTPGGMVNGFGPAQQKTLSNG